MQLLKLVIFQLPGDNHTFGDRLLRLLTSFGKRNGAQLTFTKSNVAFTPIISFNLASVSLPQVAFSD